jgi:hypothetical protein
MGRGGRAALDRVLIQGKRQSLLARCVDYKIIAVPAQLLREHIASIALYGQGRELFE